MTRLLTSLAAASATGAMVLATGCGSDDSGDAAAPPKPASTSASASSGAASKLTLAAAEDGGLSFTKKTLDAQAGSVTITMDNPSGDQMPHAIAIEGEGVDQDGEVAQPGGTSTVTVDLKPGKYTFYCPVGQHRQNGMEGTLTVQ
jgi:plastocyanin